MATNAIETAKQENGSRYFFESVIEKGKEDSSIFDFFSRSKDRIIAYKVRIPEIDAHIPEPENLKPSDDDKETHLSIELHPTYYYPDDTDSNLEIGTKVLVNRDNTDSEKNTILEVFKDQVESPTPPTSPKKTFKNEGRVKNLSRGGQTNRTPQLGADATELDKWNAYSRNSGNPLNIDIITKVINGQNITLSRETMVKYEQFVDLWNKKRKEIKDAGLGDVGDIKYKFGEAFRIWGGFYPDEDKKAKNPFGYGQFRDNSKAKYDPSKHHISKQRGTHTAGNAIDINVGKFSKRSDIKGNREYVRNYQDLVMHCAQLCGFIRFGIGSGTTIHMDTGYRANGEFAGPYWWAYRYPDGTCYDKARKNKHVNEGFLTQRWINRAYQPPDLRQIDYLSVRYGPA